jgi:hypothetical protein
MGAHINADGEFQSDKYPTCPAGKFPISLEDPKGQDLVWRYASRTDDTELGRDLQKCLMDKGFDPTRHCEACKIEAEIGSEENPHPVPVRFHICVMMKAE